MTTARTKRVLIVDLEPIIAETLSLIFSRAGFETAIAVNGEAAIAKAAEWQPDLAVLEMLLAGMTGVECAIELSSRYPQCRVILLYAAIAPSILRQAEELGYLTFTKPANPSRLIETARTLLSAHN